MWDALETLNRNRTDFMATKKQPKRKAAARSTLAGGFGLWMRWLAGLERSVFRGEPGLGSATLRVTRYGQCAVEIEIGGNVVGEVRGPDAEYDLAHPDGRWATPKDRETDRYHVRLTNYLRRHSWPNAKAEPPRREQP